MEAWDPRAGSVAEAIDRLQREREELADGLAEQVYCHVMDCGSWEEIDTLHKWLLVPRMTPDDQVEDWSEEDRPQFAFYRCAVLKGRLDILERVLQNEHSSEVLALLLHDTRMRWKEVLSDELVAVLKEAPAYEFNAFASWILRWTDAVEAFHRWFPEVFDIADKTRNGLFFFILRVMKRGRLDILRIIDARIPSEDFFHDVMGRKFLHYAAALRNKECIEIVLRWVPSEFKADIGIESGRTPRENYEAPRTYRNIRTDERTQEEGWVPDPEVVAMLTVHTKGAHSS